MDAFLEAGASRAPDQPLPAPWYAPGASIPLGAATRLLLGEPVIHGWDIARTLGRPWRISRDHARLMVAAMTTMMPLVVDPEAARGVRAAYALHVRGGPPADAGLPLQPLTAHRILRAMVGRGGRGRVAAAMLALAVTGCAPASQVASTSTVAVHGAVDGPDGSPAAGLRVGLVKQLDAGEFLGGLFVIGVSLGLVCFGGTPNVPDICARQPSSVTGRDGRFRFQLVGADTQGSFGGASTFSIVTSLPSGPGELTGPSTAEDLELQATDLEVPALRLWRPPVRLSPAGASLRVDWPAPSADYGASPGYDVRFQDAGSLPVWTYADTHPGAVLDARLLEDSHGGAIVAAHTRMPATGTTARLTYRSATMAYRGSAGAPASRGRPCSVTREGGGTVPLTPCALTDGDLVHPGVPASVANASPAAGTPGASPAAYAQVDMGAPVPVTLVVVRGCPGCRVEGSADGTAWSAIGTVPSEPGSVEPPGGRATARWVRAGGGPGLGPLREISVWTAAAGAGARPGGGGSGGVAAGGGAPPASTPATDLRPLALGLVALAAAIAALALVLARRGRAPANR